MISSSHFLLQLADFHLGALVLLLVSTIAMAVLRQPARRIAIAWAAVGGFVLLLALSAVPDSTMLHLSHGRQISVAEPPIPRATISDHVPVPERGAQPNGQSRVDREVKGPDKTPPPTVYPAISEPTVEWGGVALGANTLIATMIGGSCLALVWLVIGWLMGRLLIAAAQPAATDQRLVLVELLDGGVPPRLLVSDQLSTAVAIGLWRPTIILPKRMILHSDAVQLRTVLAHELAHLRRGDLWLLACLRLLLLALWPNPLYWLLRRSVRNDQEKLADAAAADLTSRQAYAEQLVGWARGLERRRSRVQFAGAAGLWEGRSRLRKRVAVLLDDNFTVLRKSSHRWRFACGFLCAVVAIAASLLTLAELPVEQEMLPLKVRVVDEHGDPVATAKVKPRALRSSQSYGRWDTDDMGAPWDRDDDTGPGIGPVDVLSGQSGTATVLYPRYHDLQEQLATTGVSLFVDHPRFAYETVKIDMPLEEASPYQIELTAGVAVEIHPTLDDKPMHHDGLFALWSDRRSWQPGVKLEELGDGALRIAAMAPGSNSVLLAKLDGDRVTHFSDFVGFELTRGEPARIDVSLRPALSVEGVLSENVPRPVKNGRIKARTIRPAEGHSNRVGWRSWAPIRPDLNFQQRS